MDAYYDIRSGYNGTSPPRFPSPAIRAALPITIQNMPEEQWARSTAPATAALTLINYAKESTSGKPAG